jgi:hypothetical protein
MSQSESGGRSIPSGAQVLQFPVRTLRSAASLIPGTGVARGVYDGIVGTVGAVSPRTRRIGAYAGAGVLAVAGVVEWPVAAAGAAVVWLTQPRPHAPGEPVHRGEGSPVAEGGDDEDGSLGEPEAGALHGSARQTDLARSRKARHKAKQRAQHEAS